MDTLDSCMKKGEYNALNNYLQNSLAKDCHRASQFSTRRLWQNEKNSGKSIFPLMYYQVLLQKATCFINPFLGHSLSGLSGRLSILKSDAVKQTCARTYLSGLVLVGHLQCMWSFLHLNCLGQISKRKLCAAQMSALHSLKHMIRALHQINWPQ
ncbi:hypothetical protein BY458DRAFT_546917 [Sporodiniella umbellata]|nr:hypothetical protein BY458DRAFT_546917 [Sporodiniella umbellata]